MSANIWSGEENFVSYQSQSWKSGWHDDDYGKNFWSLICFVIAAIKKKQQMEKYSKHLEVLVAERTQELIAEQKKTADLLYSEIIDKFCVQIIM